jgi:hypothetical protein
MARPHASTSSLRPIRASSLPGDTPSDGFRLASCGGCVPSPHYPAGTAARNHPEMRARGSPSRLRASAALTAGASGTTILRNDAFMDCRSPGSA